MSKARRSERMEFRLSKQELKSIKSYAERHGTTVADIFRGYIHELTGEGRQPPLPGTHISPMPTLKNYHTSDKVCLGRETDPSYNCRNQPYLDYLRCRGCHLYDQTAKARAEEKLERIENSKPKLAISGRTQYDALVSRVCEDCGQELSPEQQPFIQNKYTDGSAYAYHMRCPA